MGEWRGDAVKRKVRILIAAVRKGAQTESHDIRLTMPEKDALELQSEISQLVIKTLKARGLLGG